MKIIVQLNRNNNFESITIRF